MSWDNPFMVRQWIGWLLNTASTQANGYQTATKRLPNGYLTVENMVKLNTLISQYYVHVHGAQDWQARTIFTV